MGEAKYQGNLTKVEYNTQRIYFYFLNFRWDTAVKWWMEVWENINYARGKTTSSMKIKNLSSGTHRMDREIVSIPNIFVPATNNGSNVVILKPHVPWRDCHQNQVPLYILIESVSLVQEPKRDNWLHTVPCAINSVQVTNHLHSFQKEGYSLFESKPSLRAPKSFITSNFHCSLASNILSRITPI